MVFALGENLVELLRQLASAMRPILPDLAILLILFLAAFTTYFLPYMLAVWWKWEPRQLERLLMLNTLTGWTGVGWVASMVWVIRERMLRLEE